MFILALLCYKHVKTLYNTSVPVHNVVSRGLKCNYPKFAKCLKAVCEPPEISASNSFLDTEKGPTFLLRRLY